MLTCLRIRHLAIIDELELDLGSGLNVVTGETGAGKSILVQAMQLVLGARARPEVVRTGCERAEVEALFAVKPSDPVVVVLQDEGFEAGDELILRRVIRASGGSRASVNGRLATLAQLKRIARELVDISSQHEHTTLVDAGTHLNYLDAFGDHGADRDGVGQAVAVARDADSEVKRLRSQSTERGEREDFLRFQVAELDRIDPTPGEVEALTTERQRLRHSERLVGAATAGAAALDGDHTGAVPSIGSVLPDLADAATVDAVLAPLVERLESAQTELQDLAYELSTYAGRVDLDPARLDEVEERLAALKRLLRRFDGDEAALIAFREQAVTELSGLGDLDERIADARAVRDRALKVASERARALSERRSQVADALAKAITVELHDLGMGHARVQVEVAPLDGASGELQVDGARLSEIGMDRAEFLIAPNPGETPRSLAKVASGGELSRSLLALKRVLAGSGPVALYVFDEVDTGVGGAVAEAIGRKIREVAAHHQVLCITHQPQIAAFGDTHLYVSKDVQKDGRTRSRIDALNDADRQEELARMLSGATLTDAARDAAAALLTSAKSTSPEARP
ncbi:MAG: DNA repair protein RecN [Myxococcota bacterium]